MFERALGQELTRVAEAVPVPDDLFPSRAWLAEVRRQRVRQRWGAVVVVVAILVVGFSPAGQQAVRAASTWVAHYRVAVVPEIPNPEQLPGYLKLSDINIGDIVEQVGDGRPRHSYRGVMLANLLSEEPTWPLPTYLGPQPDAKVVRADLYDATGTVVQVQTIALNYAVIVDGATKRVAYFLNRSRTGLSPEVLHQIASGQRASVTVSGVDASQVRQQEVIVKGQSMTATFAGTAWSLHWWHAGGSGELHSNLPLAELVKIAESLPDLQ